MRSQCAASSSRSAAAARSTAGALAALGLSLLLGAPVPAHAADPVRCDNDGDPVPGFASGRDGNGCLRVDPGNGSPAVVFHHEVIGHGSQLHTYQDHPTYKDDFYPVSKSTYKDCTDEGADCGMLMYNVILDDFIDEASNTDVYQANNIGFKNRLYKNVDMGNSPRCEGGAWTGPGGIRTCSAGVTQSGHPDIVQYQCVGDVAGGWIVWQDSRLVNAKSQHSHISQEGTCNNAVASWVWQGAWVGYLKSFGSTTDWFRDCAQMGGDATCDFGTSPRWGFRLGDDVPAMWVIDSVSDPRINVWFDTMEKLVIVNTGCDNSTMSCGSQRGFTNGWPHPFGKGTRTNGPGVCPNGLIAPPGNVTKQDPDPGPDVYCYTSIEAALADTSTGGTASIGSCPSRSCPHERPPFIHLSNAGWANPPNPGDPGPPARPAAPFLLE